MGSLLLISSNDLVLVYLSIELQSSGLYLLCTIYSNSESFSSSGLIYFFYWFGIVNIHNSTRQTGKPLQEISILTGKPANLGGKYHKG